MSEAEKMESLHTRAKWEPIRDMGEAHLELREQNEPIDISQRRAGSIGVWLWMSRISLALHGQPYSGGADREYVYSRNGLGRAQGKTFLTEISPVPCSQAGKAHPLVAKLTSLPQTSRRSRLTDLRETSDPLTICYGLGRRQAFAELLECSWTPLASIEDPIFWDKSQRAFLLPFFGQGQMSYARLARFLNSSELRSIWSDVN